MSIISQLPTVVQDCIGAADLGGGTYRLDFAASSRAATAAEVLEAARAVRIAAIKSKRDAVKGEGVTVGASRFHSDADSRIQQMGLVMMGASLPAVQWKTMGGTFVEMTPTLNLSAGLSYRYDSDPGSNLEKGDAMFVTGLSLRFD